MMMLCNTPLSIAFVFSLAVHTSSLLVPTLNQSCRQKSSSWVFRGTLEKVRTRNEGPELHNVQLQRSAVDDFEGGLSFGVNVDNFTGRRKFVGTSAVLAPILFLPLEAHAERTLGTVTESYKRYVPRMEAGFSFLNDDVISLIESNDIDTLEKEITAEKGTRLSAMKGTMKIFATAFSDSVLSSTTRELQLADYKTREALDKLLDSIKSGDKEGAMRSQREAVYFAQIYSEVANASIPRSLPLINGPKGAAKRLSDRDTTSITGSF